MISRIAVGLALAAGAVLPVRAADPPVIAAAANLNFALPEIAAAFSKATGQRVRLAFGASGNLARQIAAGGPFQLFLAADEASVAYVAEKGRADGEGALYALGRLALYAPAGSAVEVDAELAGLAAAVRAGKVRRVAIANPEIAPYGRAAREVLQKKGLWEPLQGRLAFGESASHAAQFALTGAVEAALIPDSIVSAPAFRARGRAAALPAELHEPLRQRMVLVKGAGDTARAFYRFMSGPEARAILARHGFAIPAG